MKEAKLTELEIAKLKANQSTIERLKMQMQQIQRELAKLMNENRRIAEGIRERVGDCPETPVEKWMFDEVDFDDYSGSVKIPEPQEVEDNG